MGARLEDKPAGEFHRWIVRRGVSGATGYSGAAPLQQSAANSKAFAKRTHTLAVGTHAKGRESVGRQGSTSFTLRFQNAGARIG